MIHTRRVLLAVFALVALGLVSQGLCGDGPFRRRPLDPQRFNAADGYYGGGTDPLPLPGKLPYWGQAVGGTYYNWGYFGARSHPQHISHRGYYEEYTQFGYMHGY